MLLGASREHTCEGDVNLSVITIATAFHPLLGRCPIAALAPFLMRRRAVRKANRLVLKLLLLLRLLLSDQSGVNLGGVHDRGQLLLLLPLP